MEVGTILGMAGLKNSSTSKLIQFTNKLQLPKLTKNTPIKNALDEVMRNYGGGTITHSCIDFLLGNKGQVSFDTFFPQKLRLTKPLKVDNIIIITDEEQNPGSKFYKKLMEYKTKINPKVKTFIIDVSPYGDRLTPPDIEDVFYIYGWNTSVLNLISYGVKGYDKCLEEVESQ
jgi:hypothetical protein